MKPHLLEHIKILKTVPEIKESIQELKFGCELENGQKITDLHFFNKIGDDFIELKGYCPSKIIGQIHEGHLRMFLELHSKNYEFAPCPCIYTNGQLDFDELGIIGKLDNTKPYMEQSEEFFEKLNKWIKKEFNIKL